MTTDQSQTAVSAAEMAATFKVVHDHADRLYLWDYERCRTPLVTLYNKAMGSQWNSVTDLDWATDVDPESLVDHDGPGMQLVRATAAEPGSPIASWDRPQFTALGIEMFKASISHVGKLGLLDVNHGYLRERWGEAGLLEFEHAEDTASDYDSYDEVAKDRDARL